MPLTAHDILNPPPNDGASIERINHRKVKVPITIVESNPAWLQRFLDTRAKISAALGDTALLILHAGSTSVPSLPAKNIIDIDLVVTDINDEPSYVPPLTSLGFVFLFREPAWFQHRFFVDEGDMLGNYPINLHVFGEGCAEVERHRVFRDWLVENPGDRELYADVKREAARVCGEKGEGMEGYTNRKDGVVREILGRAFRELGYVE
jgi:GrpB-like predicted nucleotidyltransferase (UPF0157 family)